MSPALAQEGESVPSRQELNELAKEINDLNEKKKSLEREKLALEGRSESYVQAIAVMKKRLDLLKGEIDVSQRQIDKDSQKASQLYSLLQRLSLSLPPPVLTSAEDTLKVIHTVSLIRGQLLSLNARLRESREALARLSADKEENSSGLAENDKRLSISRARQDTLDEALASLQNSVNTKSAYYWRYYDRYYKGASDPSAPLVSREGDLPLKSNPYETYHQLSGQAFAEVQGQLSLPVEGLIINRFGDAIKHNLTSQGYVIATTRGAGVSAPYDGQVIFADSYRHYGKIVVLGFDSDYVMLIAGLGDIFVSRGDFILAGEPLGVMKDRASAIVAQIKSPSAQPLLYVELKKGSESLDLAPWLLADRFQN